MKIGLKNRFAKICPELISYHHCPGYFIQEIIIFRHLCLIWNKFKKLAKVTEEIYISLKGVYYT
jgi:hypothetical protein